jgi:predicted ester cyclase
MSAEENMGKVRAFYEKAVNAGDLTVIDDLVGNPEIIHASGAGVGQNTPATVKAWVTGLRATFPDIHVTIEDLMAHGDKVVNRVTYRGTQTGELHDAVWGKVAPTGKNIMWAAIAINRFDAGKSVEAWDLVDDSSLWQQLGLIPSHNE